jgi:hypothetical protein
MKRELAYHQQGCAEVGRRALAVEDPQLPHLARQPLDVAPAVGVRGPHEHQQARPSIDPTTSPPTVTDAEDTRCTTARTRPGSQAAYDDPVPAPMRGSPVRRAVVTGGAGFLGSHLPLSGH